MSSLASGSKKISRLSAALRVDTPTLVYHVEAMNEVIGAIEAVASKRLPAVDGRGEVGALAFRQALSKHQGTGGPVVVLLGTEVSDGVREVLSDLRDQGATEGIKLIGLTPASAPSIEMASLFPLQMAASRVLEGKR